MFQDVASIILTISDERHSSALICHPACQILLIVRRLIFAPIIRTIIGLNKSKINPKKNSPAAYVQEEVACHLVYRLV